MLLIFLLRKIFDYRDRAQNMLIFGRRCSTPLKACWTSNWIVQWHECNYFHWQNGWLISAYTCNFKIVTLKGNTPNGWNLLEFYWMIALHEVLTFVVFFRTQTLSIMSIRCLNERKIQHKILEKYKIYDSNNPTNKQTSKSVKETVNSMAPVCSSLARLHAYKRACINCMLAGISIYLPHPASRACSS